MNKIEQSYIWNRQPVAYNPANQFPGQQYGGTIQQVQNLIVHQKKIKGFPLVLAIGFNSFQLTLSGDARLMLGFAFNSAAALDEFTLKVNNEIIIENSSVNGFTLQNKTIGSEYYIFPRPLSGQDEIILEYTSTIGATRQIILNYL